MCLKVYTRIDPIYTESITCKSLRLSISAFVLFSASFNCLLTVTKVSISRDDALLYSVRVACNFVYNCACCGVRGYAEDPKDEAAAEDEAEGRLGCE